ncbi:MAG: GNAT family N-acetyltransferase [Acidiferrobacterales bacterium]|nr:GNAT family N-acetyltransferase [Acidiferrobacterales bacterium]
MLDLKVDSDIALYSLRETHASLLKDLVKNHQPDTDCLSWLTDIDSEADILTHISKYRQAQFEGIGISFGIFFKNELIGNIDYKIINSNEETAEIAGWIIESMQGKGILTKCCEKIIDYAFNTLKLKNVEVQVAKNDQRCREICENLNMRMQGIKINANAAQGSKIDMVIYSIQSED